MLAPALKDLKREETRTNVTDGKGRIWSRRRRHPRLSV